MRFCQLSKGGGGLLVWLCGLVVSVAAQGNPTTSAAAPTYLSKPYAYLGVYLGDQPDGKGALVGQVVADSPADKAGLRANDVILRLDKAVIASAAQFYHLLGETEAGSTVTLSLERAGEALTLPVQLGGRQVQPDACQKLYAQPEIVQAEADRLRRGAEDARRKGDEREAKRLLEESDSFAKQAAVYRADVERAINEGATGLGDCQQTGKVNRAQFGISVIQLSEQLAQFFKVKEAGGWLITEVRAGSLAERQGLRAGDCLLAVNGKRLASLAEFNRLLNREGDAVAKNTSQELTLVIVRDGNETSLKFNWP